MEMKKREGILTKSALAEPHIRRERRVSPARRRKGSARFSNRRQRGRRKSTVDRRMLSTPRGV